MLLRRGGSPLPPRNAAFTTFHRGKRPRFFFLPPRRFGLCAGSKIINNNFIVVCTHKVSFFFFFQKIPTLPTELFGVTESVRVLGHQIGLLVSQIMIMMVPASRPASSRQIIIVVPRPPAEKQISK